MEGTEEITKTARIFINTLQNIKPEYYYYLTIIIVAFILFALFSWIYSILSLKNSACDRLNILYPKTGQINYSFMRSANNVKGDALENFDDEYASIFRNYYVKSSYNSCCGDGYKNNFVNLCALEKCIIAGARFLDFEIYSYNNTPIIAASTANDNNIKEMYNFLTVDEVFETLNLMSFNPEDTYCANDPMIIHLRFMTENVNVLNKVADLIEKKLNLSPQDIDSYLFKNSTEENLLIEPIKNLSRKFIIIANANPSNNIFNNSKLYKFINLKSGGNNCTLYRYDELRNQGDQSEILIDKAQRSYIIILPNISNDLNNYDMLLPINNGCQAICMKFQNMDTNLMSYNEFFRDTGRFSFALKIPNLRRDLLPPHEIEPSVSFTPATGSDLIAGLTGEQMAEIAYQMQQTCTRESLTRCQDHGVNYGVLNAGCIKSRAGNDVCTFYEITNQNDCSNSMPGIWTVCDGTPDQDGWCTNNQVGENDDLFTGIEDGLCITNVTNVPDN